MFLINDIYHSKLGQVIHKYILMIVIYAYYTYLHDVSHNKTQYITDP